MAQISDSTRVASEAIPGASFTVHHATERRRRALRAMLADTTAAIRRLMIRVMRYEEDFAETHKQGAKVSDEEREAYAILREQLDDVQAEKVDPVWLRWAVSDLEGVQLDDKLLTMDDLDDLPSPLYREMLRHAQAEVGIGGQDVKNSKSPSISSGPVVGETQPTTATSAEKTTAS